MIWLMLFCGQTAYQGATCIQPIRFERKDDCLFVLQQQLEVADRVRGGAGKCVGIRGKAGQ